MTRSRPHHAAQVGMERDPGFQHQRPGSAVNRSSAQNSAVNPLNSSEVRTGLTAEESRDWGGWQRLETEIRGIITGGPPVSGVQPANTTPAPGQANTPWMTRPPPPPPQAKPETPTPAGVDLQRRVLRLAQALALLRVDWGFIIQ